MTIRKKLFSLSMIFFLSSAIALPSTPDLEKEQATLARLNNMINAMYPLIAEAEQAHDPHARLVFNYEALRHDLDDIQQGITQKIHRTTVVPRAVIPLQNDFVLDQTQPSGAKRDR